MQYSQTKHAIAETANKISTLLSSSGQLHPPAKLLSSRRSLSTAVKAGIIVDGKERDAIIMELGI
jgi:hypothetical protein